MKPTGEATSLPASAGFFLVLFFHPEDGSGMFL
jgi:hypothetical protein